MTLLDYDDYCGTEVDVDLSAPPARRWDDAIDAWGDEMHEMIDEVVQSCEEHIEPQLDLLPSYVRPLVTIAINGGVSFTGRLVDFIGRLYRQDYIAEIRGMAKRAGISYSRLVLGNLMYDLTQMVEYHGARWNSRSQACSSFSCNLRGGHPVLARNMDWAWPNTVGKHTQLVRFHRGRRSYLAVGIVGMVGVLSATYRGHWAATLNQAPVGKLGTRYLETPALQSLRTACDQFGSFRNFVNRLQQYQTMAPFFVHVVGTRANQHVVINGMGDGYTERHIEDAFLIQTNHFVGPGFGEYNDPDRWVDEEGIEWFLDTKPRYQALQRRLKKQMPRSVTAAQETLRRLPVTNENTMQSMALCPARDEMVLKISVG